MVSGFQVRLFSNDQYVLDKVLYSNFYRLKKLTGKKVVVDIGAHIGYFAIACMLSGAGKVYCYEPLKANFETLLENTKAFRPQIDANNIAVLYHDGDLDVNIPQFQQEGKFHDFNIVEVEQDGKPFDRVPCYCLDTLLERLPEESVDILKLSVGGAYELDILTHSSNLSKVKHIVGETSNDHISKLESLMKSMKESGFQHSWFSATEENTTIFIFSKEDSHECFELYNKIPLEEK